MLCPRYYCHGMHVECHSVHNSSLGAAEPFSQKRNWFGIIAHDICPRADTIELWRKTVYRSYSEGRKKHNAREPGNPRIVTFSLFNCKIEASTARCLGNCFNLVSEARWLASKWSREPIQRYVLTFVLIINEQLCYFYTNASTRGKRKFIPIGFMIFTLSGVLRLSS